MSNASSISISVNGEPRTVPAGASVAALLDHLGIGAATPGVAVALDEAVVPRSTWGTTAVEDGQRVELITATAGG